MTDILLMNLLLAIPCGVFAGLIVWAFLHPAVQRWVIRYYLAALCFAIGTWDCLTFRIQRKLRAERKLRSVSEEGGQHE